MKKCYSLIIFALAYCPLILAQSKEDKLTHTRQAIDELLDSWHLAAAKADQDTFFGSMTEEAIYLGTDASERWSRDELKAWSKKYFDRESAWNFKAFERHIYFSESRDYAWFDEKLDTWMGVCRGSGILTFSKKTGWKICHYNLAVTVPNDNIKKFLNIATKKEN